jgi:hypothetical protein
VTEPETGEQPELHFDWDASAVESISAALAEPGEVYELSERVKAALTNEVPEHVKAFIRALDYYARRGSNARATADDRYGAMFTSRDGYEYPERLSSASTETVASWVDALRLFGGNDAVVARLADLLWTLKSRPRPDRYARTAQAAFARLWNRPELSAVSRSEALVRALEIASELRDTDLIASTASQMVVAVTETIDAEEWAPGVALPMIEALAGLPKATRPAAVGDLIQRARARYADDPFIIESLILLEMQRAGADADERRRLAREATAMWRDEAAARGGLVGVAHLERALEIARNEGLGAEADELRRLLQQPRTPEELGMQSISSEVTIPRDVIDRFIDHFVSTAGAAASIARLAQHSPVTNVDSDRAYAKEQMATHPLQHLFSTTVTDADGVPIEHVVTDEQKFEYALNQHHTLGITFWGSMLGLVFERFLNEGRISAADLRSCVVSELIDQATADGVATAFEHLVAGDPEAALLMLLTRVERVLRRAARELGIAVFREPTLDGKSRGAYKGLGELLSLLQGLVPEHHRRYFMVLLTEKSGINLRNRAAHGLMTPSVEDALLALHVMLVMSTWSSGPVAGGGSSLPDTAA